MRVGDIGCSPGLAINVDSAIVTCKVGGFSSDKCLTETSVLAKVAGSYCVLAWALFEADVLPVPEAIVEQWSLAWSGFELFMR